jgi:CysZ protein
MAMADGRPQASFVSRFLQGLVCPFRALPIVLGSGRMVLLSLLPFVICLVLYVAVFIAVLALSDNAADALIQPGTPLRNVLHTLLAIAFPILFVIVAVFTYAVACFAVAAPLYEWLSAATERHLTGEVAEEPFTLMGMLGDVSRGVGHGLAVLLLELFVLIFGLLAVPVTTVLAVLASAVLLSLEFLDYPMERRRMSLQRKAAFVRQHGWELLGLGLPLLGALAVPVVGAACLPLGVVGGTLLFVELTANAPTNPG